MTLSNLKSKFTSEPFYEKNRLNARDGLQVNPNGNGYCIGYLRKLCTLKLYDFNVQVCEVAARRVSNADFTGLGTAYVMIIVYKVSGGIVKSKVQFRPTTTWWSTGCRRILISDS